MSYTKEQFEKMYKMADYHIKNHPLLNLIKVIEELSEFNRELCKFLIVKLLNIVNEDTQINDIDYGKLYNEMFDADFMMIQAKMYFLRSEFIEKHYYEIVNKKLERELKRWGLEK